MNKIYSWLIGSLLGALLSTPAFAVYTKTLKINLQLNAAAMGTIQDYAKMSSWCDQILTRFKPSFASDGAPTVTCDISSSGLSADITVNYVPVSTSVSFKNGAGCNIRVTGTNADGTDYSSGSFPAGQTRYATLIAGTNAHVKFYITPSRSRDRTVPFPSDSNKRLYCWGNCAAGGNASCRWE